MARDNGLPPREATGMVTDAVRTLLLAAMGGKPLGKAAGADKGAKAAARPGALVRSAAGAPPGDEIADLYEEACKLLGDLPEAKRAALAEELSANVAVVKQLSITL